MSDYPKNRTRWLTVFSWGWDLRIPGGYGFITRSRISHAVFFSPDGTPGHPRSRVLIGRRSTRREFARSRTKRAAYAATKDTA